MLLLIKSDLYTWHLVWWCKQYLMREILSHTQFYLLINKIICRLFDHLYVCQFYCLSLFCFYWMLLFEIPLKSYDNVFKFKFKTKQKKKKKKLKKKFWKLFFNWHLIWRCVKLRGCSFLHSTCLNLRFSSSGSFSLCIDVLYFGKMIVRVYFLWFSVQCLKNFQ